MSKFRVEIAGAPGVPMLTHNERLANRFDEYTKAMAAITSKRTKTDEDVLELARLEFLGGLYLTDDGHVGVPTWNIYRTIQEGAKINRKGKMIERGVQMLGADVIPITHDGPATPRAMWEAGCFDQRSVKVGTSKVTRTRPRFANWKITFDCITQPDVLDDDSFKMAIENAGLMTGLGDYRPRFGRFELMSLEVL